MYLNQVATVFDFALPKKLIFYDSNDTEQSRKRFKNNEDI